jgi:hypothetical protein
VINRDSMITLSPTWERAARRRRAGVRGPWVVFLLLVSTICMAEEALTVNKTNETRYQLNKKIPSANIHTYQSKTSADVWQNPYLLIRPDGVLLFVKRVGINGTVIHVDQLEKALVDIPVKAWPYGRVVAFQEVGIRAVGTDKLMTFNEDKVTAIIKDLGLVEVREPSN